MHDVFLRSASFLFGRNALLQNISGVLKELVFVSSQVTTDDGKAEYATCKYAAQESLERQCCKL